MFHRYVASVSYGYYKSRSGCCICYNGCTRILQASVLTVSSGFQTYVISMFILDVAYVSHICCKCFTWMSHMLAMVFKCFLDVLQVFQT